VPGYPNQRLETLAIYIKKLRRQLAAPDVLREW
jgi:hypothetical protein